MSENRFEGWKTLEGQIRECFGRVVYSHKTHEKCSDILLEWWRYIKLSQISLSVVTTGGFVTILFGEGECGVLIGGISSVLLLVLNAYTKDYDLAELSQKHKQTASELWMIRERYLSLITDIVMKIGEKEGWLKQRDVLLDDLHHVYQGAPPTDSKSYERAQDALKNREDLTLSDAEIDAFLPSDLRRGNRKPPTQS